MKEDGDQQPQPVTNGTLTNMLQWAITNTNTSTDTPKFEPQMTPEEYKIWADVMFQSETELMKKDLSILKNHLATNLEREKALSELQFRCETIDNANDLPKIGGLELVMNCLEDKSPAIKALAIWTLATCVQNNPKFQQILLENKGLEIMLNLLRNDLDAEVRAKALSCLSGTLKHNQAACDSFSKLSGWHSMVDCFKHNDLNLSRKLTFILNNFIHSNPSIKELLMDKDTSKAILGQLSKDDADLIEKTLSLLDGLIDQSPRNAKLFRDTGAKTIIEDLEIRLKSHPADHQDSYDEIYVLLGKLKKYLNK